MTASSWEPKSNARTSSFAEFAKFQNVGDSVIGRVAHLDENDTGRFAVFSPCLTRTAAGKLGAGALEMAIGISAGLRNLLTRAVVGKWVIVQLDGFDEEVKPGQSAMKLYKMWTLSRDEALVRYEIAGPGAVEMFTFAEENAAVDDA